MRIAIIAITRNGARLGARLKESLGSSDLHVLRKYIGHAGSASIPFDAELGTLVRRLWPDYKGFVCIMATGIVVRVVAPLLESKEKDPAVVVMDDAGRFSISLLSGHLGGGNLLAERASSAVGARAIITTATDANELPSFDMIAKAEDWEIDDIAKVKVLNSLLLDGEDFAIVDPTEKLRFHLQGKAKFSSHASLVGGLRSQAKGIVLVSSRIVPPQFQNDRMLVLRPKSLFLGIGCNRGTSREEISDVVSLQMKRQFLSMKSVAAIATAEAKRGEEGLERFAGENLIPLRFFSSEELNSVKTPTPPSKHVMEAIGASGVAEPAALLASCGGSLILAKVKSGNVTVAIAENS